jgi:YHS domain-containing protein
MKLNSIFLIVSLVLTGVFAQAQSTDFNTDATKIALQGYSPVSYLDLNLAQRGSKEFKATYDGIAYYFTSAEQKTKFEASPIKYVPQYGGYCATGIAVGAKFRTDPNKFIVTDGKLFVFLYDLEVDAKQLWLADEKGMHAKAETNWKTMSKK